MPTGLIKIDVAQLRAAAVSLTVEHSAIAAERKKIQGLDSLRSRWRHADNDAFMQRLSELQQDMLELEEVIQAYISSVNNCATAYEEAQRDVLNIAKNASSRR